MPNIQLTDFTNFTILINGNYPLQKLCKVSPKNKRIFQSKTHTFASIYSPFYQWKLSSLQNSVKFLLKKVASMGKTLTVVYSYSPFYQKFNFQ